ncbi:MAG: amino acid adenylation domain-containing protein, partial [Acidobacteria bacterium]|nr:amino acid adenylation domain-containing protein [Acidobacteriota bacterium]
MDGWMDGEVETLRATSLQITYFELNEQSNHLAGLLIEKGVQPDTIVGIMMERSIEMITGILGILKSGGAYLPIDPGYPQERIDYMLKDSNAKLTINYEFLKEAPQAPLHHSSFIIHHSNHLAYVIYTSGSTGRPKGVLIQHDNVIRLMINNKFQFKFDSSDVWTLFHSFCFDFSVWEMYGALLYGGKLVIITKTVTKDPVEFLKILKKEKVSVLNQTPQAFYNLIDAELKHETAGLNLRYVIFGGEALSPIKLKNWQQKYPGVKLINMYGITETTVHVTYKEIGTKEIAANISNIGTPIPTLTAYIMDRDLNLLPIGLNGELCVGGKGVARGYLNRPELTHEKFVQNPYKPGEILYRSGDLVKIAPDGEMEYLGRVDHQVKIRGFRIEIEEIESQLLKQKEIKDAVVACRDNNAGDKYLCAYVVVRNNYQETDAELAKSLKESLQLILPEYMIPSYFIRLEKFPLTVNGKLDLEALPEPQINSDTEYAAPVNEIQAKMVEVWQQVLGHHKIGIKNNFFSAGGDSINAIKLISQLNVVFNTDLLVADLYNHQTIEALSEYFVKHNITSNTSNYHDELLKQAIHELEEFKNKFNENNKMTAEIEDVYPMGSIEQGMVYHYLKDFGGAFYFEQNAYKVKYPAYDFEIFKQALNVLVEKHPILRTGYDVNDFAHVIYKTIQPVVSYQDITGMNEQEQQTYVADYIEKSRQVMFERLTPPLWRITSFNIGNENIIFLIELHHALLDGWSLSLFLTELEHVYLQLKSRQKVIPGKLNCSYRDYIISELAVKKNLEMRKYWENELADYKRFTLSDMGEEKDEFREICIDYGQPRLEQLQRTAVKYGTTLKHLGFAAYVYAMGMLSYENDIVLGLITNNRPICEDGDKLLGCFLNSVPVRIRIPAPIKWREFITQIDEKLIEIKKNDLMPLNEILKIIGEKASDSNPVFDIIFNFIDFYSYRELQSENYNKNTAVTNYIRANTLFDFNIDLSFQTFRIICNYSTLIMSDAFTKKLCSYFDEVLNKFISEPDEYAVKNSIISEEEKEKILFSFNETETLYPKDKTIDQLFAEQAARTPDYIALHGGMDAWRHGCMDGWMDGEVET